eukprot:TRINITY_DN30628_c0_g1_i1.p1 TRINITY_DN30628_c0_g1~~TRINITY_DN30628_c0_g1_i1.p1  ORF type:complete len:103 (+),score=23.21 TRINITY_DN30628_c0_g1_i1:164-472(+)
MLRSLVGSEMCIRDRVSTQSTGTVQATMGNCECHRNAWRHRPNSVAKAIAAGTAAQPAGKPGASSTVHVSRDPEKIPPTSRPFYGGAGLTSAANIKDKSDHS